MSLIVWLPLNGDLHNQGISDIATQNMGGVSTNSAGKIGACMSFNGSSTGYLRMPAILTAMDNFSICFWMKLNNNTGNHCLYSQRTEVYATGFTIFYMSDGGIRFDDGLSLAMGLTLNANQWYHVTCCRDNDKKYIYIDGVLNKSDTRTVTNASKINTNYSIIGGSQNNTTGANPSGNYFNGYLNDFRIYNHCLSAAEVKKIAQGLVLHYKLDEGNENLLLDTPKYYKATAYNAYQFDMKENLVAGQTYTIQLWDVTVEHSAKTAAQMNLSVYWGGGSIRLHKFDSSTNFTILRDYYAYSPYLCAQITPTEDNASSSDATNKWLSIYNSISNADGTRNMKIGAWKLEKGAIATQWVSSDADITKIQDSSGYGHNGTIVGTATTNIDTPRYSYSTSMNAVSTTNHIESINTLPSTIQTISFWMKNLGRSSYVVFAEPSSGLMFAPIGSYAVIKIATSNQTCYAISSPYYIDGAWNHIVVQKDGTTYKLWTNGTLRGTSGSNYYRHDGDKLYLFNRNYNSSYGSNCIISDFRAYTTLLSEDDIKQLYQIGAKIDNLGNLHTFEFNENGSNKLTKTGILKDYAIEPYKTLSDGSCWKLMLFHYVDGGNNLFTSSNAAYNNGFGLYSRLRDIENYTYNNQYEYYVIQDGTEFRWTQTSSPTAASITGLTTVSGYNDPVNGLAKANQNNNTYIGYNSWWGACGCWTKYTNSGKTGIPGFGTHDVTGLCTDYLALYVRIDKSKIQLINGVIQGENLIEF